MLRYRVTNWRNDWNSFWPNGFSVDVGIGWDCCGCNSIKKEKEEVSEPKIGK